MTIEEYRKIINNSDFEDPIILGFRRNDYMSLEDHLLFSEPIRNEYIEDFNKLFIQLYRPKLHNDVNIKNKYHTIQGDEYTSFSLPYNKKSCIKSITIMKNEFDVLNDNWTKLNDFIIRYNKYVLNTK